jgi:pyrimidine-nucleoside phosphorylase
VLDVKVGSGAFMKTVERARELASTLVAIGRGAGKRVTAFLTDMDQPLGRRVGNALEVTEAILQLRDAGAPDVRDVVLALGAEMMVLGGVASDEGDAREKMKAAIAGGAALKKFAEIVEAQGGDPRAIFEEKLPTVATASVVASARAGVVAAIQADEIGLAALALGAGRLRKEDAVDPAVGIELLRKVGERVGRGEPIAALHHRDGRGLEEARRRVERAYRIADDDGKSTAARPLVIQVMR